MVQQIRKSVFYFLVVASIVLAVLGALVHWGFYWPLLGSVPLVLLGCYDLLQTRHSILRNFPIIGHLRFLIEGVGPEFHQYIVESNVEGRPFDRDQRSLVYRRAKNVNDDKPFGTELDVYGFEHLWLNHSIAPKPKSDEDFRIDVGGEQCKHPYAASIFNISAMSFGSLSANAIRALNAGAKRGGFAHDTGEGGISRYHREHGGDLIWEIGSGYFGCRQKDGTFDPARFSEQAQHDQVKMVEIKVSQGAKPGHGGVLPGAKVSPEIAEARGVPVGVDCVSPAFHTAFSTPIELLEFVQQLRELSGGKPAGFKLCIGQASEFLGVCKAMLETEILPDFIVVDGAEGGTGAAPLEFQDHLGTPLREGLVFVHNALTWIGVRPKIRLGASGKIVSGFGIASHIALGADWANSARGFMFAVGCIQAQSCHTNKCPVGVATQDHKLQRALVVSNKADRVYHFHRNTMRGLAEIVAAAGLDEPWGLTPWDIVQRISPTEVQSFADIYDFVEPGEPLHDKVKPWVRQAWEHASPTRFRRT